MKQWGAYAVAGWVSGYIILHCQFISHLFELLARFKKTIQTDSVKLLQRFVLTSFRDVINMSSLITNHKTKQTKTNWKA